MSNSNKYVVRTMGEPPFYLIPGTGFTKRYAWRKGVPGSIKACRFDSQEEAQAVIDGGYSGASGHNAEVIEVDS